jgi:hypothetical protein
MHQCPRSGLWLSLAALMIVAIWGSANADPLAATISLGRDPEPPGAAMNPGGTVDIWWNIEHTTTPNYVYYKLGDPTRTIIYEDSTYAGSSGTSAARQWIVPVGAPDGKYWIRVEYWSFEAGNEANAEVTFYVCSCMGNICAEKWEDTDCDDTLTAADAPVPSWWLCIETPLGDTFCRQTDANGVACWYDLPVGDYRVYEVLPGGWVPIYPESYDITLTETGASVVFFNKVEGASATEEGSWGRIKSMFE